MSFQLVTAPTAEPVTATEAKDALRIDTSTEDTEITRLITMARQEVEDKLRMQIVTATWDLFLDCFPTKGFDIEKPPVQSVTSITYQDSADATQTLATTVYDTDLVSRPGRVRLAFGQSWPTTYDKPNAVTCRFTTGYGLPTDSPATIPETVKQLVILIVGREFDGRDISMQRQLLMERIGWTW